MYWKLLGAGLRGLGGVVARGLDFFSDLMAYSKPYTLKQVALGT